MIDDLEAVLPSLQGRAFGGFVAARADDFSYTDPVDKSETPHAGIRILFTNGSRIVCRLSGTGTEGATMRLYLERYSQNDTEGNLDTVLQPLNRVALDLLKIREHFGHEDPTLIT
jgi:phosphoglucomutase